jgi:hypothetical protein
LTLSEDGKTTYLKKRVNSLEITGRLSAILNMHKKP